MTDPEAALTQRLTAARVRRLPPGSLAKWAEKLLHNEKFLESIRGQFTEADVERLKDQFREGKLSANDPELRDLFEKAKSSAAVTDKDRAELDQLTKKLPEPAPNEHPDPEGVKEVVPKAAQQPEPAGATPWQQDTSRANDWLKGNLDALVKGMDRWADSPSAKSWADSLRKVAERAEAGNASASKLGERADALSGWLGKMGGDFRLPPARLGTPSLPNVGAPSGGSLAGASGVVVVLLLVLLLAVVLTRGRDWFTSLDRARRSAWRLGPWPVRPEAVATRGDLVAAFEYLALLCLGPAARTCHHLELGERIGEQPAADAERRRAAASSLSRLYERARYTPDQEPLPGEDLRRARRELAYLAGARG